METGNTVQGPKQQAYTAFWERLLQRIRDEQPSWTTATRARGQSWITLPFGVSKIWYGMLFTIHGLSVELYFGSPDADENTTEYLKYEAAKDQIEADFGSDVSFQALPDRKACRITVYGAEANVLNPTELDEYSNWFMSTFERFRHAIEAAHA